MIDYTHPARPARHAACATWDDAGHACVPSHDCDAATIVTRALPLTGNRWVITGGLMPQSFTPGPAGRGAHRLPSVSLVKGYITVRA